MGFCYLCLMLNIGQYQTLTIIRETPHGFYLECEEGEEVLFPRKFITEEMKVEDKIDVFVYRDSENLDVATTEKPIFTLGQFTTLEVQDVNRIGAFCEWGVTKQLFIPYRNQERELLVGQSCVVYLYLDELTDRLVGSTKLKNYLEKEANEELNVGQRVELIIYDETEIGYKAIVEQYYTGLIYKDENSSGLQIGESVTGFIKYIRKDRKIDLSLMPLERKSIEPTSQKILERLRAADGFLPFNDKTNPEILKKEFGMSKKMFKKSIGSLYKQKLIAIKSDGIHTV